MLNLPSQSDRCATANALYDVMVLPEARISVTRNHLWSEVLGALGLLILIGGCASTPNIEVVQELESSADVPYRKILVVTLFDSFDARRYLEGEIVKHLAEQGTTAIASTSMMDTRTPLVRQTFIDMIDETGADALLLTQLTALRVEAKAQDVRPQATYNYSPTYYWNMWAVELTEYVEPPRIQLGHSLVLATQAFSVDERVPVWAIESKTDLVRAQEDGRNYQVFVDEANAIVKHMKRHGLIEN